jgi:hypothetical protein
VSCTDPEGSYSLRAPAAGTYLLAASAAGHHPAAFLVTVLDRPVQRQIVLANHDSTDSPPSSESVYELGGIRGGDYW